jgi:hypothetical protein
MKIRKSENKSFKKIEILEDAMIVYSDGKREVFDGIEIRNNKVIFGRFKLLKGNNTKRNIKSFKNSNKIYVETGAIPKSNIKNIKGGKKRLIFQEKIKKIN